MTILQFIWAIGLVAIGSAAHASVDYQYPDYVTHTIEGRCLGIPMFATYTTWEGKSPTGLRLIRVGRSQLRSSDLRRIEAELAAPLARVSIVGCRKTRGGDIRVQFAAESVHPDPTTSARPTSKSFYVRDGRLEFFSRPPND